MSTFAHSDAPLKTVKEIQFGLFSPEEIKNMSVCHIEYPETMDEQRNRPRERGLNDPKLGTIDRSQMCATCGESQQECPGHFGHIELAVPVYHVGKSGTRSPTRQPLDTDNHVTRLHHQDQKNSRVCVQQLRKALGR